MVDKVFAGTIVCPDRIVDNGYVLVGDGKVQSVGSGGSPCGEKHGGHGFLVFPGAIDAQVHSRSQFGHEEFIWSTRSAAARRRDGCS
jgi:allantoinase